MTPKKVELLAPAKLRRKERPTKFVKLRKLSVEVEQPGSAERRLEDLILFDARFLDNETRRELLRILPTLLQAGHAWMARFADYGCISCHRKKVSYASGGFCSSCYMRELHRMRSWYRTSSAARDTAGELASITGKYDAAQALLNGDDL